MHRASTTVVTVVGAGDSTIEGLRHKANVAFCQADPTADALHRAVTVWGAARRSHATYFVHDADPLVSVAEAWSRYFEGAGPAGELEVAMSGTLARWRAGSLELPDYYLVCSPEDWPPLRRHWYLGVLADACALRVVTTTGEADMDSTLAGLPAGRWWPELDHLLAGIEGRVPDQVALSGEEDSARLGEAGLITPGRSARTLGD